MNTTSAIRIAVASLLLVCSVGCQQRMASKLQGRWEGRPDFAARRAAREGEKYGDQLGDDDANQSVSDISDEGSGTKTSEPAQVTDWEGYDVTIVMDFVTGKQLEMSLNGDQPKAGDWKVVSTSPAGCTIEVQTESDSDRVERRRFDLLLDEREGNCVGFQLSETGADPQLGALYFRRPQTTRPTQSN